jgi:hypothetical protein
VAGGAALAGVAGGLALGARNGGRHRKVLGIKIPHRRRVKIRSRDLASAAKNVGSFGEQLGELTTEVRRARQGIEGAGRRSPIEVVLQGLTRRSS